jgi:ribosomal protein L15
LIHQDRPGGSSEPSKLFIGKQRSLWRRSPETGFEREKKHLAILILRVTKEDVKQIDLKESSMCIFGLSTTDFEEQAAVQ